MPSVHLLLGSNLGHRAEILARARQLIEHRVGPIEQQTVEMTTQPWGYDSNNAYLNQIIVVHTDLAPLDLLDTTQQIERELGRKARTGETYEDRPIDIDILYYDDLSLQCERLTIPHPRIEEREFVLTLLSLLQR